MRDGIIRPLLLRGFVQHYAWGKRGSSSLVARSVDATDTDAPCAELWFGTHPKGPTRVEFDGSAVELCDLVAQLGHKILGQQVHAEFSGNLPFLCKILSINEALSIQAHPSTGSNPHSSAVEMPAQFRSDHAGYLHWKDPVNYPDPNHKPELAIALTTLSLLQGFKPVEQLLVFLRNTPEMIVLVGEERVHRLTASREMDQIAVNIVREMYRAVVEAAPEQRAQQMMRFKERLLAGETGLGWEREHLLKMFATYGPQDVGIPTALMMNWVQVPSGQAVYMGPNQLHAYLEGEILECMATSDNVVRAGLTAKFQDLTELLAMVEVSPAETPLIRPSAVVGSIIAQEYHTPAREFQVMGLTGPNGAKESFACHSVSFVICTAGALKIEAHGSMVLLSEGQAALIPAAAASFSVTLQSGLGFIVAVPAM